MTKTQEDAINAVETGLAYIEDGATVSGIRMLEAGIRLLQTTPAGKPTIDHVKEAAPDMLDALKAVLKTGLDTARVKAAIAKAEGK